jgi:nucleotide-binding universal stress UspA family protein
MQRPRVDHGPEDDMAYRTILVPQLGDASDTAALDVAWPLASRFHAHVRALHVRWPLEIPVGGMMEPAMITPGVVDELERVAERRATVARQNYEAWRGRHTVEEATVPAGKDAATCEWVDREGAIEAEIARAARLADVVVLGRPPREHDHAADVALEGALFHSGRPVIVVPGPPPGGFETVLVAWNDSAQAARAVSAAAPLIGAARRIVVFVGAEHARLGDAEGIVQWLNWRGYAAPTVVQSDSGDPAVHLLSAAQGNGAGLIVMGAYTHSRLRHLVFGGVTTHLLRHSQVPLFMAH